MSEQPYMQLWIADFLGDTLHLTSEEIGQYMLLLMAMWRAGGYLPVDETKLARIARGQVSDAVMAFFSKCEANADGLLKLTQKRLLAEVGKARAKSIARSEAGKAGAEAKALKHKETTQANAKANAQAKVQHSPEPEPLATNVAKRESRAHQLPQDWWPTENHFIEGEKLGFNDSEVEGMGEDMRCWAWGKGEARKNWNMVFSGWMRRERKRSPPKLSRTQQAAQELLQEISDGSGRRGICDEGGESTLIEFPKPAARPQNLLAATGSSSHWAAKGGSEGDG